MPSKLIEKSSEILAVCIAPLGRESGKARWDAACRLREQEAEIIRLRSQLATARKDVLEEAAKVAECWGYSQHDFGPHDPDKGGFSGLTTFDNRRGNEAAIASAIRALGGE